MTTLTVSASRLSVVTAKYLYVATLGILAGVLNVAVALAVLLAWRNTAGAAGEAA